MSSTFKFTVSNKKKATINQFKDHVYLHFNESHNGNKKSLTFSEDEFHSLQKLIPKFEKSFRKLSKELKKKTKKTNKTSKTKKHLSDSSDQELDSDENSTSSGGSN